MKTRAVSVGVSRLFQVVEVEDAPRPTFRVEQALVKEKLPNGKTLMQWMPVAVAFDWVEAHRAMYQVQADYSMKQQGATQ